MAFSLISRAKISIAVLAFMLTGCAVGPANNAVINAQVEAAKTQAKHLIDSRVAPVETSLVSYSDSSWIPLTRVEKSENDLDHAKTDAVQIEVNQHFVDLNEVAATISSMTGLPVIVGTDVRSAPSSTTGAGSGTSLLAGMPTPMGAGLPSQHGGSLMGPGAVPSPFSNETSPVGPITANSPFAANYSGSLTGFMNLVSAYYGVFWKTESSGLQFYLLDSKTFRIAALPGDTKLTSTVESASGSTSGGSYGGMGSGGSSGDTQSGSSSNSTSVAYSKLSVWSALQESIKQMLGKYGKVVASPATGTITVTDTPSVLSRVAEFIDQQNKALNRQVSVNVRVLSVELNDGENYGINWDSVYANLASAANPYSIAFNTAFPTATGGGNFIISAPASSTSQWAGSSAMISALSTQGRVKELTSATLVTLNNQAAPVNVGRRVAYLASSSTTQTANVGSTTSLTPGIVQTGFSMTLVPHIINSKELLLQYSLDLSSLLDLKTITSGTSTIETPDISTSNFIQRVRMKSGETLVVAGFDQDNLSAVGNGVGSPNNTLMGQRNGTTKRTLLVVLIQPILSQ